MIAIRKTSFIYNYNIVFIISQMKRYKNNKKHIIKWLTSNPKWVIIKP
nr:MAG TPA: hypothetical protein [Caudoviricetes sp.]